MMTPQEVASHAFTKATLGGYNMAMVDEFLDLLTEDYTALYNDNAILKNKLKVLSDTVEEYRATDDAMRKTLLAAQKMADAMVADAEAKKNALVQDAEEAARQRIDELKAEIAAEEYRLQAAQESTASYVAEINKLCAAQQEFLAGLGKLAPPRSAAGEARLDAAVSDIEDAVSQLTVPQVEEAPEADDREDTVRVHSDPAPSAARFEDLQFGKDYEIK